MDLHLEKYQKLREPFGQDLPSAPIVTIPARRAGIGLSSGGFWFVGSISFLLVVCLRYGLNSAYLLLFVLVIGLILSALDGAFNLAGLTIRCQGAGEPRADQPCQYTIELVSHRNRSGIELVVDGSNGLQHQIVDLVANQPRRVSFTIVYGHRGLSECPQMMIQTRYSTGLWRLYVRWRSSRMITVLPAPIQNQAKQIFERQQTGQKAKSMQDDNTDLKPYVAGESLRRVAWKTYAKTDGRVMVTRTTSPAQSSESSIGTLSSTLLGRELEAAISGLASWVEFSESNGAQYGLKLGLLTIPIGCGPAHATRCMIALALYDPSRATEVAL